MGRIIVISYPMAVPLILLFNSVVCVRGKALAYLVISRDGNVPQG